MTDLATDLVPLIERYVGYTKTMDFAAKRALWDADDPAPLLMPEESTEAHIGWPAIQAYWGTWRGAMESVDARTANHHCRLIAPDIALVTYDMRWSAVLAGAASEPRKPIGADVRVTALLRRKPEGWRFFHLMEGAVDLTAMARVAAERSAVQIMSSTA
jgi:ketosteroid isomerase-like protein